MNILAKKVNAFTDSVDGGNPAGVVLNSPKLTEKNMAFVTKFLKVSETAFVFLSNKADYKIRFFSPEKEVDLCGHATIATFFTMGVEKKFVSNTTVTQETKAGILPVEIIFLENKVERVMMTQGKPILKDIQKDIHEIAESLKISINDIDDSLPNQIVSTGLFTLPICIKDYQILKSIKPYFIKIEKICKKFNVGSFHLFSFDTIESRSIYHARNFAPLYGINEDPVTGTANGAVCYYLLKNNIIQETNLFCEQGDIINRPGRVYVEIKNNTVKVGGRSTIVKEYDINL